MTTTTQRTQRLSLSLIKNTTNCKGDSGDYDSDVMMMTNQNRTSITLVSECPSVARFPPRIPAQGGNNEVEGGVYA